MLETFYDKVWTEGESRSILIGAIWQVDHDLALDAAYRYAIVDGRPVNEIRAGLTFAFKEEGDKNSDEAGCHLWQLGSLPMNGLKSVNAP